MGFRERETTGDCPLCGHSVVGWEPNEGVVCYQCGIVELSTAWVCASTLQSDLSTLRSQLADARNQVEELEETVAAQDRAAREWKELAEGQARDAKKLEAQVEELTRERDASNYEVGVAHIEREEARRMRDAVLKGMNELASQVETLQDEVCKLRGQLAGWAEEGHAEWCCGPGDSCCCGHEEVEAALNNKE